MGYGSAEGQGGGAQGRDAAEHFGPFGMIMTLGVPPMSNASTRQLLGWAPGHPGLIADLEQGYYFAGP